MGPRVLALVLAGGRGTRMGLLCAHRPKPMVPFFGQLRLIDFTLSNLAHSNLGDALAILDHHWAMVDEYLWSCPSGRFDALEPLDGGYSGAADAIRRNLHRLPIDSSDAVLVLEPDQVYEMDYGPLVEFHLDSGQGLTVGLAEPRAAQMEGKFEFTEEVNPVVPTPRAAMGVYVFEPGCLIQLLEGGPQDRTPERDLAFAMRSAMHEDRVRSYRFDGYWCDIDDVESYYQAHMDYLRNELAFPPIPGITSREPPHMGTADGSYIDPQAIVLGDVESSWVGPQTIVEKGATVHESVVLGSVTVGEGALIERAVLDDRVQVGPGSWVGCEPASMSIDGEITVLGRGSVILPGSLVPPNSSLHRDFSLEGST